MPITESENLPIRDAGAHAPPLGFFYFLGTAATCTITGHFVDMNGRMVGLSFTKAINTASGTDPQTFTDMYGKAIPEEAVGFVGQITGQSCYVALIDPFRNPAAQIADFKANYARYQTLPVGARVLGRVSSLLQSAISMAGSQNITPLSSLRPVTFTLSLDTSAYASGDVLADTQLVTSFFRATDAAGFICAIQLLDEDDNTAYDIDLLFLTANNSIGTENSAISVTDANARTIANTVSFSSANIKDQINSKAYYAGGSGSSGLMIPVKAVSGTASLAIAAVVRSGTPTHTASGLTGILWVLDAL